MVKALSQTVAWLPGTGGGGSAGLLTGRAPVLQDESSGRWLHGSVNAGTLSHALKNGPGGPRSVFPRTPYKWNHEARSRQGRARDQAWGCVVQAAAHASGSFLFAARSGSALSGSRARPVCSPVEGYSHGFHFLAVIFM